MHLPNPEKAVVDEEKLVDYLLSATHPIGRFKARVFASIGFVPGNWEALRDAILQLIAQEPVESVLNTEYGKKFTVFGTIEGPKGQAAVVTVWIVRAGDDAPRLVTVYPR